ncbi:protein FANTASTIC FOUR 3 [Sesamum alatum]|uniref:Protein FANTASTIC FOUR 3 n=1 Tax=Sesamum alatum TaxID=300844 RepID=A0AAE2CKN8_9LAMI|nr:protein FANTASTIC FOUR 3 [Sesamum alatum]
METTTTLKLKGAAAPPDLDFCKKMASDDHPAEVKTVLEYGNWGFLQTGPKESGDKESCIYTHPLARKSSFSRLSAKSLELCTENLGSETGSDIVTDDCSSIFSSPPLSPSSNSTSSRKSVDFDDWKQTTISSSRNPLHREASSCRKTKNFPPPLTTMSGSSSLQVRRHREDGRLIIEAVEAPFRNSYLQAERSDGRLRLCYLTGSDRTEITTSAAEEEEENGDECGGESAAEEEEIEEASSDEEAEFDGEINLEMEMEKFQWLSRCKEGGHGNKGLCSNWKPALWVAIS